MIFETKTSEKNTFKIRGLKRLVFFVFAGFLLLLPSISNADSKQSIVFQGFPGTNAGQPLQIGVPFDFVIRLYDDNGGLDKLKTATVRVCAGPKTGNWWTGWPGGSFDCHGVNFNKIADADAPVLQDDQNKVNPKAAFVKVHVDANAITNANIVIYANVSGDSPDKSYHFEGNVSTSEALSITTDKDSEQSNPIVSAISHFIAGILYLLAQALNWIFGNLLAPIMQTVLSIRVYTSQFSAVILPAWVFLRNLMNIFFILALIMLAIGTLFQMEGYNYKHTLVEIVKNALLVNFSLVIAQVVLGVAQTLQAQFLPSNSGVITTLGTALIVTPLQAVFNAPVSDTSTFVSALVIFIFSVGSFMAFVAITILLCYRIVALWFLLATSPIAYAGEVLSFTKHFSHEWWSYFIKYAFFTPVLALLLNVCAIIANAQTSFFAHYTTQQFPTAPYPGMANFIMRGLSSFVVLICLFFALEIAMSFNIGKSVLQWAEHQTKRFTVEKYEAAGELAKKGGEMAYGGLQTLKREKTAGLVRKGPLGKAAFAVLNPGAVKKQVGDYLHHREEHGEEAATAAANVLVNQTLTGGARDTEADYGLRRQILNKLASQHAGKTPEELKAMIDRYNSTGYAKSHEGQMELAAVYEAAIKDGRIRKLTELYKGKGNFNQENAMDMIGSTLHGHELEAFKQTVSRSARESKRLAWVGVATPDSEKEAHLKEYLDELPPEDIGKVSMSGIPKDPTKVEYKVFVQKLAATPTADINKQNMEYLFTDKVDAKTGAGIFKNEADARRFEQLKSDHPDLYTRLQNLGDGVRNPASREGIKEDKLDDMDVLYQTGLDASGNIMVESLKGGSKTINKQDVYAAGTSGITKKAGIARA